MKRLILIIALVMGMTGVSEARDLTASWYNENGVMANGRQFSPLEFTCASRDWPLGTTLEVTSRDNKARVVVLVTDRTAKRFKGKRIDLSPIAFRILAPLSQGLVKVNVKVVRRTSAHK